jgi:hypothetical protein
MDSTIKLSTDQWSSFPALRDLPHLTNHDPNFNFVLHPKQDDAATVLSSIDPLALVYMV